MFEDADVGKRFKLWPRETLTNTYADSDQARAMASFNRDVVAAFNDESFRDDALLKLSWTLTPQASTIVRSLNIFEKNPKSLLELAASRANPPLRDFATDAALHACSLAHIVVVDDFDHSSVVDVALASNVRGMFPKGACAWSAAATRLRALNAPNFRLSHLPLVTQARTIDEFQRSSMDASSVAHRDRHHASTR